MSALLTWWAFPAFKICSLAPVKPVTAPFFLVEDLSGFWVELIHKAWELGAEPERKTLEWKLSPNFQGSHKMNCCWKVESLGGLIQKLPPHAGLPLCSLNPFLFLNPGPPESHVVWTPANSYILGLLFSKDQANCNWSQHVGLLGGKRAWV